MRPRSRNTARTVSACSAVGAARSARGNGRPIASYFAVPKRVEREYVDPRDVVETCDEIGKRADVLGRVVQAGHQHEADPCRTLQRGEPVSERQGRRDAATTGHLCVDRRQEGLDVEQDQVGVEQQIVRRPGTEGTGCVQCRVDARLLAGPEHRSREARLQQRFTAGDRDATAGPLEDRAIAQNPRSSHRRPTRRHRHVPTTCPGSGSRHSAAGSRTGTATKRVPGPSTPVERSQEWTAPVTPRTPASVSTPT